VANWAILVIVLSFGTIETGMNITKLEDLRGLEANQGTVDFSGRITNKSKGARGSFGATFGWKGCETHLFVVVFSVFSCCQLSTQQH
jgi:hypothetical protein